MTQKHTLMPMRAVIWRQTGHADTVCIYDALDREVVKWTGFDGVPGSKAAIRERAKFIARACNSHYALLEALEELHLKTVVGTDEERHAALNKAWAAITLARGNPA